MLGSIRGKVIETEGLTVLIETSGGIGYEVDVPANIISSLVKGEECFLYLHHAVREDAELLYGFADRESRMLFREIIKITGVGPKVGMALLSSFSLNEFCDIINGGRTGLLTSAPGVGKKTAERIIVEMKDRMSRLKINAQLLSEGQSGGKTGSEDRESSVSQAYSAAVCCDEAISALMSLGYKEAQAMSAVKQSFTDGMTTENIIVAALAALSRK